MKYKVGDTKTVNGEDVRLYATDGGGPWPIHGAYLSNDIWHPLQWDLNGKPDESVDPTATAGYWEAMFLIPNKVPMKVELENVSWLMNNASSILYPVAENIQLNLMQFIGKKTRVTVEEME